jgi:putative phosphoesterase
MSRIYVGLVSDSHGRMERLEQMAEAAPQVTAWIHGGDYCDDANALAAYTGLPVYGVRGNNDFFIHDVPDCRNISIGGVTLTAVHGHQWYSGNRTLKLVELGRKNGADLVLFGHTHRRFLEKHDGIFIVNPGSISLSRDSRRGTYGICSIDDGVITEVRLYEV